jgi:hypothetical protein
MPTQARIKVARPYQVEAFRQYDPSGDWLIEQPTGSGKTLLLVALVARHLPAAGHVIIAAPMEHIEAGFTSRDFDAVDVGGEVVETPARLIRGARASSKGSRVAIAEYLSRPAGHALATTHQAIGSIDLATLPDQLDGKVLMIDEAHHAGADALGRVASGWRARGGHLLFATATPYRHDGRPVATEEMQVIRRSLAEQMEEGYAPRSLVTGIIPFGTKGDQITVSEFTGTRAHAGFESDLAASMVERWREDGEPKLIVRVPPIEGGSARLVIRLLEGFESAGARTLDATGTGPADKRRVLDWLDSEKRGESAVDVVVGSQRVIEGTDWPSCSTLYCLGLPGSLGLVVQLIGRTTRQKPEGYPERHRDTSTIRFFVPTAGGEALERLPIEHSRNALLVVAHLADSGLGQDYAVRQYLPRQDRGEVDPGERALAVVAVALARSALEAEGIAATAGSVIDRAISDNPGIDPAQIERKVVGLLAARPGALDRLRAAAQRVNGDREQAFEAVLAEFREETLAGSPVLSTIEAQAHELAGTGMRRFAERLRVAAPSKLDSCSPSGQLRSLILATGLNPGELSRAVAEGDGRTGLDPNVIRLFLSGHGGLTTESIDRLGPVLGLRIVSTQESRANRAPLSDQLRSRILAHGSPRSVAIAVAKGEGSESASIERQLQRFAKGERSMSLETVDRVGEALSLQLAKRPSDTAPSQGMRKRARKPKPKLAS